MRIIRLHLEPGDVSLTKCSCILNSFFLFFLKKAHTYILFALISLWHLLFFFSWSSVFSCMLLLWLFTNVKQIFFCSLLFFFPPRLPSLLVSSIHITLEILPFYTLTMSSLIPETDWVASVWKHLRKHHPLWNFYCCCTLSVDYIYCQLSATFWCGL